MCIIQHFVPEKPRVKLRKLLDIDLQKTENDQNIYTIW